MNSLEVLAPAAPLDSTSWRRRPIVASLTLAHALLVLQLALATGVVYLFTIEGPAFFNLFLFAAGGFVVNLVLPAPVRLKFFVGLSLTGAVVVFGPLGAAWLIGSGLLLIGLCHLPVSIKTRVAVLLVVATALAVARSGAVAFPMPAVVWPILGSMFMFRLVLYMLALKNGEKGGGIWTPLAYFFMLPNLAFPLFPVVDYQTFRRTYYDKSDVTIYEQGLVWITRGLVHLLLYRLVYQTVLGDPVDVVTLGDLAQFMLGTFLLYLRVSGQFHLIVGMLHLFGFRLPETHKLYYLAHSFTELWRRINIYWTDFMMKAVFYPTYFQVKKRGPQTALVLSTTAVFLVTWILHSYQWFWLRAGFPLTIQDTLFWGILGALVVIGALRESTGVRKAKRLGPGWNWRFGLKAATTFICFCFLWSLWSAESMMQWIWMLGAAANPDLKGIVLVLGTFGVVFALGGRSWEKPASEARAGWLGATRTPALRISATLLLLLALGQPGVAAMAPARFATGLHAMHQTGLNARDAALQHRGYYEQLDIRAQLNSADVLDKVAVPRDQWVDLSATGVLRERNDFLTRDLHPSRHVLWNGNPFSTNRWGMRDREYSLEKPAGTLRIALLGPSHVMGNGVGDGETFEALIEDRLNRDGRFPSVEILNFAVDGFSLPQQVAMLEERVFQFAPDVVIATHYHRNLSMTERHLLKVLDRGVEVRQEPLHSLLAQAGLVQIDRGRVPLPFPTFRRLARAAGIDAGMPAAEAASRIRGIADDVLAASIRRFAEVTRQQGALPVMLGVNAVIDDAPATMPDAEVIAANDLQLLNLLDVFPEAERPNLRVAPWDDHPNAAGHRLIAERLYGQVSALLREHPAASRLSQVRAAAVDRRPE